MTNKGMHSIQGPAYRYFEALRKNISDILGFGLWARQTLNYIPTSIPYPPPPPPPPPPRHTHTHTPPSLPRTVVNAAGGLYWGVKNTHKSLQI